MYRRKVFAIALFTIGLLLASVKTTAQTYTDLHDFDCATDGCSWEFPGLLAQGRDGNLYGTLSWVGAFEAVTVVEVRTFRNGHDSLQLLRSGRRSGLGEVLPQAATATSTAQPAREAITATGPFSRSLRWGRLPRCTASIQRIASIPTLPGARQERSILRRYVVWMRVLDNFLGRVQETEHGGSLRQLQPAPACQRWELLRNRVGGRSQRVRIGVPYVGGGSGQYHLQFRDWTHGAFPYSPLVQGSDNLLYGVAVTAGANGGGVIFKMTTAPARSPCYTSSTAAV